MAIRHRDKNGLVHATDIPGTLAALSSGAIDHFVALRPHQAEPWHVLTVQIAVLAMERAGPNEPPSSRETWSDMLAALTPQWPGGEAWSLVVDDPLKPAFLQPPDSAVRADPVITPDGLDTIVAGRNHDVKKAVIADAMDDDWLFALVALQTTEGSMGAGTKAVSRMNGGYGSRTTARIVPPGGASASFLRDVRAVLQDRRERPEAWSHGGADPLLWTRPVSDDPAVSIPALDIDALYIEVCRRVRLRREDGRISAYVGTAIKGQPVTSERGQTRCPWTPIMIDREPRAYSPGDDCDWRSLGRLLDPDTAVMPLLATPRADDPAGSVLRIAGLKRGQGATERFDLVEVPVGRNAEDPFSAARERRAALDHAWRALRVALVAAMQKAPATIRFDDAASSSWAAGAARELQEEHDARPDAAERPAEAAAEAARSVFAARAASLPGSSSATMAVAIASAEGRLENMLRKKEHA